jgi:hypothetical protein
MLLTSLWLVKHAENSTKWTYQLLRNGLLHKKIQMFHKFQRAFPALQLQQTEQEFDLPYGAL